MEKKEIKVLVVNPHIEVYYSGVIDNTLQSYYDIIGCSMIDISALNSTTQVILDDEGLLKPNRHFKIGENIYAGTSILTGFNEKGETTDISNIIAWEDMIEFLPESFDPPEPTWKISFLN